MTKPCSQQSCLQEMGAFPGTQRVHCLLSGSLHSSSLLDSARRTADTPLSSVEGRKCVLLLPSGLCLFAMDPATDPTLPERAGKRRIIRKGHCPWLLLLKQRFSVRAVHQNHVESFVKILILPGSQLQRFGLNWSGVRPGHLWFQKVHGWF